MKCKKCGTENAPIKKCCSHCGAILEGFTINNVTGEYGYRGSDGLFYKAETEEEAIQKMEQYVSQCNTLYIFLMAVRNYNSIEITKALFDLLELPQKIV